MENKVIRLEYGYVINSNKECFVISRDEIVRMFVDLDNDDTAKCVVLQKKE